MPAKSKAQKRLMSWALGVKKGKTKTTSKKVKELAKGMSVKELEKYAKTKMELPETVKESNSVVFFDDYKFRSTKRMLEAKDAEKENEETEAQPETEMETAPNDMGDALMAPEEAEVGDNVLMNIKSPEKMTRSKDSYEWSEPESKMIQFQLKNIIEKAEELMQLFDGYEDVEDWIQAKMTVADNYISNVRDYMKHK